MSSWRSLNFYSKVGVDSLSIPAAAVAPWFFQIFIPKLWVVLGPYSLILIFCHLKKIRARRLLALIKRKMFVREIRMANSSGHKSVLGIVFLVSSIGLVADDAHAAFELLDVSGSSYTAPAAHNGGATYSAGLPKIQGNRLNGYGHQTPLKDVMVLSIPATWDVRYSKPELRDIKIDFRADNISTDELLQDVATRYGVTIKVGESSGVVQVDWTGQACTSGNNPKLKLKTIC